MCAHLLPVFGSIFSLKHGANRHLSHVLEEVKKKCLRSWCSDPEGRRSYCPWASSWAAGRRRRPPARPWRCRDAPAAPPSPCGRWCDSCRPGPSPGNQSETSGWRRVVVTKSELLMVKRHPWNSSWSQLLSLKIWRTIDLCKCFKRFGCISSTQIKINNFLVYRWQQDNLKTKFLFSGFVATRDKVASLKHPVGSWTDQEQHMQHVTKYWWLH